VGERVKSTVIDSKALPLILATMIVLGFSAIVAGEAYLPQSSAAWVLCIPLIVLTVIGTRPGAPIWVATVCSVWVILDLLFFEIAPWPPVMFLRRGIGISSFFSVAIIVRYAILARTRERQDEASLKKFAEELAQEKQKLERSNRELEQFAGVAAHDLRAPIASIQTWADMLREELPQPINGQWDEALSVIQNNAKRASDLITDVLAIARVNVGESQMNIVDLNEILHEVKLTFEHDIKSARASIYVDAMPCVWGNRTYLGSVFSNLIRNALTYHNPDSEPKIWIGYRESSTGYEFYVRDNGIGIDPVFKGRIFQMFQRFHDGGEYPGNGIGLAFCKKVVELCGGKIWVDSSLGNGSTFTFSYPRFIERGV
jgi:two-component system, chemotaxis family, sensor kinase Cph1